MSSRRKFIKTTALGISAAGVLPVFAGSAAGAAPAAQPELLHVGAAGYTFHNLSVDQSVAILKQVEVKALSLKDFHLPFDSSPEKIAEVLGKFHDAGIEVYAAGVIYMKSEAEVDRAFDYAKKIGVNMIVGVPNYELLGYTEQKVKSSNIR